MRITTTQMYDNLLIGIQKQSEIQAKGNSQISAGTRFSRPSEAGLDYKISLNIRHAQSGITGSLEAIKTADLRLGISQTMLQSMNNVLVRAQTLSVQLSSAQNSADERANAAIEVGHLVDQLVSDANQTWQGQSLFAGTATDRDAFINAFSAGTGTYTAGANTTIAVSQLSNANAVNDTYTITLDATGSQITAVTDSLGTNQLAAPVALVAGSNNLNLSNGAVLDAVFTGPAQANTDGGSMTVAGANQAGNWVYNGSAEDRIVAINDHQQVVSNVRGDHPAFTSALNSLKSFQTALSNNDLAGIQTAISDLTSAGEGVISLNTEVGSRIKSLEAYKTSYEDVQYTLDRRKNEHEGVDVAAVMANMQQASIALQASYSQIASLKNLSLVNFLR